MSSPARPAAPAGTRTRAGNGMLRSRAGILAGAGRCVARYGTRKTTMADIAREGGVAKATLYNHFRTKDEVYAALVDDEVARLLARLDETVTAPVGSPDALVEALATAAAGLSEHPVVVRLSRDEPGLLAALLTPGGSGAWQVARAEAMRRLTLVQAAGGIHPAHDPVIVVDALLRWVVTHALWPSQGAAADQAHVLVHGLLSAPRAHGAIDVTDPAPLEPSALDLTG